MPEEGTQSESAKREQEILSFWKSNGIFEKTLEKQAPNGEFVFYDGPPFATGLPHYGHMLPSTIKDAIPRYKTMRGYRVPRRWGWDCHGLPLENQIEKELNLATKRDIEILGVAKFNDAARGAVLRYADDWKKIIPRLGRFVDMDKDYRTMDATYTESVWWAFKNLYDRKLIYEGFKSMHLCPRCGTTLSNFEVAQGYKDITDISVTVKLELKDAPKTFLLAWTTTPWTLPGNMAAAVNKDFVYVVISIGEEKYILAKERLHTLKAEYVLEREISGSELVGKSYTPPFSHFAGYKMEGKERAWKIYHAPYVTLDDGTGIVHLAPAFGAEDLELAEKEGIPIVHHVNKDGFFVDAVSDLKHLQAKPKDDPQSTDVTIIKMLAASGHLFAKEKVTHSYPHCWRCDTPLLNYASSSWFVKVTSFKDKLIAENNKIHWIPHEVGQNRFGDWLQNARDWAISRARYWGAPIPVWRNPKTKQNIVIGSLDDLKRYTKKSGNRYIIMRHGEADSNVGSRLISSRVDDNVRLTQKGRHDVEAYVMKLKSLNIDVIFSSPYVRAKETVGLINKQLKLPESTIHFDARLSELDHGVFSGTPLDDFYRKHPDRFPLFEDPIEGGESFNQVRHRMGNFLYELDKKYTGKTILIVSHKDPLWMLAANVEGIGAREAIRNRDRISIEPGEVRELEFSPIPHNENYELDFHRPYIDYIHLEAKDGTRLERVPDVFDCWFESGSMSYAQNHYPFQNKDVFDPNPGWFRKSRGYPANFISESLDQTRGWFYSMLVLGVALFGRSPYKSVIVSGIVLAEDGQKMSKRLKNYPELMLMVNKYGADAIRYYLLASPLLRAEDLNFSEKGVGEVASKVIGRLTNVLSFYELYKDGRHAEGSSINSLDLWIKARLSETIADVTKGMESYELDRAARPIASFVEDLSTWYIRRSRDRFKDDGSDGAHARETTRVVLETFSKVIAPFMPFTAEYIYQKVKKGGIESVHLEVWPDAGEIDLKRIADMNEVREVVSLGLEARQKANIKVRQPLARATTKSKVAHENAILLREELNVKEVVFSPTVVSLIELDTTLTGVLREEGELRDLIREVQDLRKQAGLNPKDAAHLLVSEERRVSVERHWEALKTQTNLISKESSSAFNVRKT